jgi:hypothetical protein
MFQGAQQIICHASSIGCVGELIYLSVMWLKLTEGPGAMLESPMRQFAIATKR